MIDSLAEVGRRRRIRRIINALPPAGLSAEDAAAYAVAHARYPDMPAAEIVRRLPLFKALATRSFYRHKFTQLVRRRKAVGKLVDLDDDPELLAAADAAATEELEQLVPGQSGLYEAHRSTDIAGRFTVDEERRFLRQQAREWRRQELADERAEAEERQKAMRLKHLNARLDRLGVAHQQALDAEARERRYAIADIVRGAVGYRRLNEETA